jgi:putative transposase
VARRRHRPEGTPLSAPLQPNDLWCADYKGKFMLADRRYRYPLTVTDFAGRYLISCEALGTTAELYAFTVFERALQLEQAIRLVAAAGIQIERIKPGCPQQNGRHERMHLTLKQEATRPAAANLLQQQARFDTFITCYNRERPTRHSTWRRPPRATPGQRARIGGSRT